MNECANLTLISKKRLLLLLLVQYEQNENKSQFAFEFKFQNHSHIVIKQLGKQGGLADHLEKQESFGCPGFKRCFSRRSRCTRSHHLLTHSTLMGMCNCHNKTPQPMYTLHTHCLTHIHADTGFSVAFLQHI